MQQFQVGDWVRVIDERSAGNLQIKNGMCGMVCVVDDLSEPSIGVKFEQNISGNTLNGTLHSFNGWFMWANAVELVERISVGSVVMLTTDHPDENEILVSGDIGVVCDVRDHAVGVDWGNPCGHNCNNTLGEGNMSGWYVLYEDIAPYHSANSAVPIDESAVMSLLS